MAASYVYSEDVPDEAGIRRLVLARVALIPFFIISVHPRWIQNDAFGILLLSAHGMSSGYAATMCMILAPTRVQGDGDKEIASMEMVFLLMCGLATGAIMGSIIDEVFAATGGVAFAVLANATGPAC